MINIGSNEMAQSYIGLEVIVAIYLGLSIIWEAVNSCYGAGMWLNDKPWSNDDGWKN